MLLLAGDRHKCSGELIGRDDARSFGIVVPDNSRPSGTIVRDGVDLSETFSDLGQCGAAGQLLRPRLQQLELISGQVGDRLAAGGHAPRFWFDLQQLEQFVGSGSAQAGRVDPVAEADGVKLCDGVGGFHPGRFDSVPDDATLSGTMQAQPMQRHTEHADGDRYAYDWGACSDFAQIDTSEDASWFGMWACPVRLVVFTFCEGDCTTVKCETAAEFRDEMHRVRDFANRMGKFHGVDPGTDPTKREAWEAVGLAELLH